MTIFLQCFTWSSLLTYIGQGNTILAMHYVYTNRLWDYNQSSRLRGAFLDTLLFIHLDNFILFLNWSCVWKFFKLNYPTKILGLRNHKTTLSKPCECIDLSLKMDWHSGLLLSIDDYFEDSFIFSTYINLVYDTYKLGSMVWF